MTPPRAMIHSYHLNYLVMLVVHVTKERTESCEVLERKVRKGFSEEERFKLFYFYFLTVLGIELRVRCPMI
jgi:hypothetical protein